MKIKYDPQSDVLLITLNNKPLAYGEEIFPRIIAHYSDNDELVEIEILDASEIFSKKNEFTIPHVGTKVQAT